MPSSFRGEKKEKEKSLQGPTILLGSGVYGLERLGSIPPASSPRASQLQIQKPSLYTTWKQLLIPKNNSNESI